MIGWCSPVSQRGRPTRHPANVGCSFFRYMNGDLMNYTNQRRKRKALSRENNQLALHCYFRSNTTQRGYWERMIVIWQDSSNFQITSQRLADQVKTIIKKGYFSDLEIIEIHLKINNQQGNNRVSDTSNVNKQKHPNRNEPPTSEQGNSTQPNNVQPNNSEQILSQEPKVKSRKFKENYEQLKDYLIIIEKYWMKNS